MLRCDVLYDCLSMFAPLFLTCSAQLSSAKNALSSNGDDDDDTSTARRGKDSTQKLTHMIEKTILFLYNEHKSCTLVPSAKSHCFIILLLLLLLLLPIICVSVCVCVEPKFNVQYIMDWCVSEYL